MGYYTRVFCRAEKFPSFSEIQIYLSALNPAYKLEGEVDDNNAFRTNFEVSYKEGKHPIPVHKRKGGFREIVVDGKEFSRRFDSLSHLPLPYCPRRGIRPRFKGLSKCSEV